MRNQLILILDSHNIEDPFYKHDIDEYLSNSKYLNDKELIESFKL